MAKDPSEVASQDFEREIIIPEFKKICSRVGRDTYFHKFPDTRSISYGGFSGGVNVPPQPGDFLFMDGANGYLVECKTHTRDTRHFNWNDFSEHQVRAFEESVEKGFPWIALYYLRHESLQTYWAVPSWRLAPLKERLDRKTFNFDKYCPLWHLGPHPDGLERFLDWIESGYFLQDFHQAKIINDE